LECKTIGEKAIPSHNNYTEIKGANFQLNGHQIQQWAICKME